MLAVENAEVRQLRPIVRPHSINGRLERLIQGVGKFGTNRRLQRLVHDAGDFKLGNLLMQVVYVSVSEKFPSKAWLQIAVKLKIGEGFMVPRARFEIVLDRGPHARDRGLALGKRKIHVARQAEILH